ncbi:MAG: NfeD family protein [Clostridia bacterium]|nr:NfeD family protein [Clostridia bacterium]MBR5426987.1 NfeD family protein [Clostridia bacterium]
MTNMMAIIWGGVLVLMLVIEAASVQLTSIWFAAGALVSLIAAIIKPDSYVLQVVLFIVVSAVALIGVRPLVKKRMKARFQPTNADKCLGKEGVVTETIDGIAGTGLVKLDGAVWTARSADDSVIEEGALVVAEKIAGVKLIVHRK